jgi:hypothetical protein
LNNKEQCLPNLIQGGVCSFGCIDTVESQKTYYIGHSALGLGRWCLCSDAIPMLAPKHSIYEKGCSSANSEDDYGNGVSFKENMNSSENKTKYYSIIGGSIIHARKVDGYNWGLPKYKYFDVPLIIR